MNGEAGGPTRERASALSLALLVVLSLAPFVPMLLRVEVPVFRDHVDYFAPLRYFTTTELRSGSLPLWNPYSASGEPWLANPQTGVFYPPAWIFLILRFETAYVLYLALHLAIATAGMYRMLATRLSGAAALVGAIALGASGPLFSLIDISNNFTSFAWMPWVVHAALARWSPRRAGAVIALSFLAGEPFYAALGALLYVVIVREWRRVAWVAVIAAGLSAAQLLPFIEMVAGSDRAAGLPAEQIFRDSAAPRDWLRLVVPPKLTADVIDRALTQHFITIVYCGVTTGLLALFALLLVRRRAVLWWALLLVMAFCVSIGPAFPPIAWLLQHMPLTLFRYPARLIPVGALALSALAAIGWDRIRPKRMWADVVVVMLLLAELAPVSTRVLLSAKFDRNPQQYADSIGADAKMLRVGRNAGADRQAWIAGYLNLYARRFDGWSAAPLMSERYLRLFNQVFDGTRLDLVDRFPARWILADRDLGDRFEKVAQVRRVITYENRHALPMAVLWTQVRPAGNAEAALRGALDPATAGDVYISPPPPARFVGTKRKIVPAVITRMSGHDVRVAIDSPFAGVLVLSQCDAPGWHVSVDGRPAKKLLADGNFRAVALDSGPHVVDWSYRPLSLIFGVAMTLITAGSLLFSTFVKTRRAKKFSS